MAKTKTETAVAVIEETQTALATIPQDLLDAQGAGTENVRAENMRPPRLQICQVGSAQAKRSNPKYIQGIAEGDLFNSLTGEMYARPLRFVVIQRLKTNFMQFAQGEVGKVIDYDVPDGDPRTKNTFDAQGNWVKPVATQFDNFLVLLPDTYEVVLLSFKSTALESSRFLDNMLKYPMKGVVRPPAWARQFTLDTGTKSGSGNSWATPQVVSAGLTEKEIRFAAATLYDQYKGATIDLKEDETITDAPDDSDISF